MNKFVENFEELSDSEKRVCQFIIANVKRIEKMNVYSIADEAFSSKTVVINTAKKLGFTGFTDMKYYIKQYLENESVQKKKMKSPQDFNSELIETVKMTCNFVGQQELENTAKAILHSNTVYVAARGTSKSVAQHLNHVLITIGIKSVLIDDYNLLSLVAERIDKRELMILISLSGETSKIVDAAKKVKAKNATLVAITSFTHNSLSKLADTNIYCVTNETDTIHDDSISRIGMFVNIEMICNRVKSLRGCAVK